MEGVAPAVFRRRKPGALRRVELLPASADRAAVVVEFVVPDPVQYAEIEAASKGAMMVIQRAPAMLTRYGLPEQAMSDEAAGALREVVFLVEAGVKLWKACNFLFEDEPADVLPPLDAPRIAQILHDPFIRAAWSVHLSDASALERAEGNGSGVSPSMSSGGAPNTADDAPGPTGPVAGDSPDQPDASATG